METLIIRDQPREMAMEQLRPLYVNGGVRALIIDHSDVDQGELAHILFVNDTLELLYLYGVPVDMTILNRGLEVNFTLETLVIRDGMEKHAPILFNGSRLWVQNIDVYDVPMRMYYLGLAAPVYNLDRLGARLLGTRILALYNVEVPRHVLQTLRSASLRFLVLDHVELETGSVPDLIQLQQAGVQVEIRRTSFTRLATQTMRDWGIRI